MSKKPAKLLFEKHLQELKVRFEPEYRFHPIRMWRFDWLLPDYRIGIECEGAIWIQGRHTRGMGYQNDMRKYNAATVMGFRVLRFSTSMIEKGEAKAFLAEYLGRANCSYGARTELVIKPR
jgi:very-short-patch-repair endonuclease